MVVESTGFFTARDKAAAHLDAGAPVVIVSAPATSADATFVIGVNDDTFDPANHKVVSNASCTTNCFVPMVKVLDDAFGVEKGLMTTVHAYTGDQNLVDGPHKRPAPGPRRGHQHHPGVDRCRPRHRPGARSHAGQARRHVAPGARCPTDRSPTSPASSKQDVTVDEVNEAFKAAAASGPLAKVLDYTDEPSSPPTSSARRRRARSTPSITMAMGNLVKVLGWYDNEWGYSNRLVDLVADRRRSQLADRQPHERPHAGGPRRPRPVARVLLRADFNVPIADGEITDDLRIRAALPTIEWLHERGATVTACTHLGRPKGTPGPQYSVEPVRAPPGRARARRRAAREPALRPGRDGQRPRLRADAGRGPRRLRQRRVRRVAPGPRVDRRSAEYLPSAAGRLLPRRSRSSLPLRTDPKRPFVAILGGSKVSDKLGVIQALLEVADALLIGGGMCFTFLAAQGHHVGASLLEDDQVDNCRRLLDSDVVHHVPRDITGLGPGGEIGDPAAGGEVRQVGTDVPDGWMGLDIGPGTAAEFGDLIAEARTVLWNGPMGVFEDPRFEAGTRAVAQAVADTRGFTVVGGGDSAAALAQFGLDAEIDHVSTGGGASLELLEQGDLPGLEALARSTQCLTRPQAADQRQLEDEPQPLRGHGPSRSWGTC